MTYPLHSCFGFIGYWKLFLPPSNSPWSRSWKWTLIDWSIIHHHTQPLHAKMESPIMLWVLLQVNLDTIEKSKLHCSCNDVDTKHLIVSRQFFLPDGFQGIVGIFADCWQTQECHESCSLASTLCLSFPACHNVLTAHLKRKPDLLNCFKDIDMSTDS